MIESEKEAILNASFLDKGKTVNINESAMTLMERKFKEQVKILQEENQRLQKQITEIKGNYEANLSELKSTVLFEKKSYFDELNKISIEVYYLSLT